VFVPPRAIEGARGHAGAFRQVAHGCARVSTAPERLERGGEHILLIELSWASHVIRVAHLKTIVLVCATVASLFENDRSQIAIEVHHTRMKGTWMEIVDGIHRFDTGPFNWYLIEEGGRLTLVDAGFPSHYGVFVDGLAAIGRTLADLEAVILTHSHADHTGFAARLQRETNARILVHRDDRDAISRQYVLPWAGLVSHLWRPFTASIVWHAVTHGLLRGSRIPSADVFDGGDELDVPGHPTVIHVPGHTDGEVAFFLAGRGVLFSGDTLVTRNLYTGAEGTPQVPSHGLNTDDELAMVSLDRMRDLGTVTMLPGHGRPWHGRMDDAVRLARQLPA